MLEKKKAQGALLYPLKSLEWKRPFKYLFPVLKPWFSFNASRTLTMTSVLREVPDTECALVLAEGGERTGSLVLSQALLPKLIRLVLAASLTQSRAEQRMYVGCKPRKNRNCGLLCSLKSEK